MGRPIFKILVISTQGIHVQYMEGHELTIGRSEEADLCLQFSGISRKHLSIASQDGKIYIKDNNSKYGTRINGSKIQSDKYVSYKPFERIQFSGVPDVVIGLRLVPRVEAAGLESSGNTDFMSRVVKHSLSQVVSHIFQGLGNDDDAGQSGSPDKIVAEERRAVQNLAGLLTDAQAVADGIRKNAIRESEVILEGAKQVCEEIKSKANDDAEKYWERKNDELKVIYSEQKKKVLEFEKEVQGKAQEIIQGARAKREDIVREASESAQELLKQAESEKEQIQKKIRDEAIEEARKEAGGILNEARQQADRTLAQAVEKAKDYIREKIEEFQKTKKIEEKKIEEMRAEIVHEKEQHISEAQTASKKIIEQANQEKAEIEKETSRWRQMLSDLKVEVEHLEAHLLKEKYKIVSMAKKQAEEIHGRAKQSSRVTLRLARQYARRVYKQVTSGLEQRVKQADEAFQADQAARRKKMADLESHCADLESQKSNLTNEVSALSEKSSKLQKEVESLFEQAERIKIKSKVTEDELARIEEEKKETLKAIAEKTSAKSTELAELTDVFHQKERELQEVRHQVDSVKQEMDKLRHQRENLHAEVEQAETQLGQKIMESRKQSEGIISQAKAQAESLLNEAQEKAQKQMELVKIKIHEDEEKAKKVFEEMKLAEERKIASLRIEGEKKLQSEFVEVRRRLDERLKNEMRGILEHVSKELRIFFESSELAQEARADITQRALSVIDKAIQGESLSDQNQLQEMFMFDVKQKDARKKFWKKSATAAAAAVIVFGIYFSFKDQIFSTVQEWGKNLASNQQEHFANEYLKERREAMTFKPTMTEDFKGSYTENVIYTSGYLEFEKNDQVRDEWILKLNEFFEKSLKLDETTIVKFNSLEVQLIKNIEKLSQDINPQFEKEAIARIREAEAESLLRMKELLGGEKPYQRFWTFKKEFFVSRVSQSGTEEAPYPANAPPTHDGLDRHTSSDEP